MSKSQAPNNANDNLNQFNLMQSEHPTPPTYQYQSLLSYIFELEMVHFTMSARSCIIPLVSVAQWKYFMSQNVSGYSSSVELKYQNHRIIVHSSFPCGYEVIIMQLDQNHQDKANNNIIL